MQRNQIMSLIPHVSYIPTLPQNKWNLPSHITRDLIHKTKEQLRGIRFRTVPEILQAVDRSSRTIETTGAAKGILQLPHRWQRVVQNAGDYAEGQ
jgi:hypothetical protein